MYNHNFSARLNRREYSFNKGRILLEAHKMNDRTFKNNFRTTPDNFRRLLDMVGPHMRQGHSTNNKNILPVEKLLVFLFWSGGGSTNVQASYSHSLSSGTIFNCIDESIDVLKRVLVDEMIVLPDEQEARREAELFYRKSNFPKIAFGAIDGTHIPVSVLQNFHFLLEIPYTTIFSLVVNNVGTCI